MSASGNSCDVQPMQHYTHKQELGTRMDGSHNRLDHDSLREMMSLLRCKMTAVLADERAVSSATANSRPCT